jgi:hypothetical protein
VKHPLGDDLALYLLRAAVDRLGAGPQVAGERLIVEEEGRTGQIREHVIKALLDLGGQ